LTARFPRQAETLAMALRFGSKPNNVDLTKAYNMRCATMKFTQLTAGYRFAIALAASMGMGHVLFRALTSHFGPVAGLFAGTCATAVIAGCVFCILEWSSRIERSPSNPFGG
jgi:hypothetical protein